MNLTNCIKPYNKSKNKNLKPCLEPYTTHTIHTEFETNIVAIQLRNCAHQNQINEAKKVKLQEQKPKGEEANFYRPAIAVW